MFNQGKEGREVEVNGDGGIENSQVNNFRDVNAKIKELNRDEAEKVVDVLRSALNDLEHTCTLLEVNNCAIVTQAAGMPHLSQIINNKE